MTETIREVNAEEEGEDLIPKEMLPTDPGELAKAPESVPPEAPKEPEVPESPEAPDSSPEAPVVEKPEVPLQPAPVEGETQREKALRLEIQRLRGLVRKDNVKEIVDTTQAQPVQDEYKVLKDQGYTDEEIAKMETAVDLIASKKGYVRADRNYAQSVQDTVDLFTDAHPEYKPANDPDDIRWNLFQNLLKDGTYNLAGKSPKQLTSIFEKVDDDVRKQLGESVEIKPNPRQVAAQKHKVEIAS